MITRTPRVDDRGSVMVEFTLSLTFLVPLFLGLWEFGFAFYQYSKLENGVRAGARYASMKRYDSANTTPTASFLTAVQRMTVYGDPNADPTKATPVVPGLTTDNVQLGVTFSRGAPSTVTVAINNYQLPTYIGKVTLRGKPYVWFPHLGMFGPP
jgi:Flp pilus assembly protein TadG